MNAIVVRTAHANPAMRPAPVAARSVLQATRRSKGGLLRFHKSPVAGLLCCISVIPSVYTAKPRRVKSGRSGGVWGDWSRIISPLSLRNFRDPYRFSISIGFFIRLGLEKISIGFQSLIRQR